MSNPGYLSCQNVNCERLRSSFPNTNTSGVSISRFIEQFLHVENVFYYHATIHMNVECMKNYVLVKGMDFNEVLCDVDDRQKVATYKGH